MRLLRPIVCLLAGVVAGVTLPALAEPDTRSDADLHYGVALYHYYQQQYLHALSELMVAENRGEPANPERNAQLIEGGVRLAFGMPESAGALFGQVLDDHRTPAQRAAAWFYLGKLHYLHGQWTQARERFEQADKHLTQELDQERQALLINLSIRTEQWPPPANAPINPRRIELGPWSHYALYNLAAAQARVGNYPQARQYYSELISRTPSRDERYREEHLALRDKAFTGAGYSYLLEGDYAAAVEQFQHVRLSHQEANQALLGYGWAEAEAGDYEGALRPWQVLSERPLIHAPVQESLLALPYAYQQLGAPGAALQAYDRAEEYLQGELDQVAVLQRELSPALLLNALTESDSQWLSVTKEADANWLTLDRGSVVEADSAYLAEVFRVSAFQVQVQAVRDLLQQRELLSAWLPKLSLYGDLLRNKRDLRQRRESQLQRESAYARAAEIRQRRDGVAGELDRVRQQRDYLAFADSDTWELLTMIERAERSQRRLAAAGQNTGDAQERLRLFRGLLIWNAAQEFPDRLWRSEKTRRQLDEALDELHQRRERVQSLVTTDFDIQPALARLAEKEARIREQLTRLDVSLEQRLVALVEQVQGHLSAHETRLNHYLARSRLAAAQVQDQALREARQ